MPSVLKSCCAHIPQRWVFTIMGFLALFNAYGMRVCLSIAITEMVVPINETKEFLDDTCASSENDSLANATTLKGGTFEWDEYTQGIILSAFYWGAVIIQLPSGLIAEKIGGKYVLGVGIFIGALQSALTPCVVIWGGANAFIFLRFLMGLGSAAMYPACNVLLSEWIPLKERSKAGAFVWAGAPLGTVFATSISGLILQYSGFGWPAVFYFFGGSGILWFILFMIFCYDTPVDHPFISDKELKYLSEELSQHRHKKPPAVPWSQILKSKPVWASIIASTGNGLGFFTLISDLNKYMSSVLKFSIQDNGYLSSLPYLCMWFGSLFTSWISDWLIMKETMSPTNVRKLGTTIASVGPAFSLIVASYAGCDRILVVTMITVGMTLLGSSLPSIKVNVLDLSPNYSGSLMALTNLFSAVAGIFGPYVVGLLTPHQTLEEWRTVFWLVAGVFIFTNIIFIMFASGDVQEWNDPEYLMNRKEIKKEKKKIKEEVKLLQVATQTNKEEK